MPDESRVFDVSKPSKFSPSATSKPVIVGHHPIMNDPMVKGEHNFGSEGADPPTKIPITDASMTVEEAMAARPSEPSGTKPVIIPPEQTEDQGSPAVFSDPADELAPPPDIPEPVHQPESIANGPFTEPEPPKPAEEEPASELPKPAPRHHEPHIEGLHFTAPKRQSSPLKKIVAVVLVLLIASYLAVDSGALGSGIKLPFHIFKQKTKTATAPPPAAKQPAANSTSLPAGFKEYKIAGTSLTFAAPAAWGDPTSTTDSGYSKRGGGAAPDGTYAYLVNFDTNKDIQIAVTSSKYLPAARTPLYYDYLQWCTGTSDGLIYESTLNFSTTNKIETPTTVTCNQGPVAGSSKLDSTTIIQAQAKDTAGKVIGDIYTKNLKNDSLVVFRVKDAVMTNGTQIKQLLNTIQVPADGGTSAP